MEFVRDFLYGLARARHEEDGTTDDSLENKILDGITANALNHG